jgi:hypothetical protein
MLCPRARASGGALLVGLALALAMPRPAQATVMVPMSIEQLASDSVAVVRAKVLRQEGAWDRERRRIYTHTEVEILQPLRAGVRLPRTVVIRSLGGEVGELGMKVSGSPRFSADEEVVVFLRADPVEADAFQVVGMAQGKFGVTRTKDGRVLCAPSLEGLAFARSDASGQMAIREADPPGAIPLAELESRVRAVGGASGPSPARSGTLTPAEGRSGQPAPAPR